MVNKFSVFPKPAHGWIHLLCHLYKVKPALLRQTQGLLQRNNARLFSGFINQANLWSLYEIIEKNAFLQSDVEYVRKLVFCKEAYNFSERKIINVPSGKLQIVSW